MKLSLRSKNSDMREGPILSKILAFALPIFLGSVFQQFYSMVDSIVVGKFVSADALAAVGSVWPAAPVAVSTPAPGRRRSVYRVRL